MKYLFLSVFLIIACLWQTKPLSAQQSETQQKVFLLARPMPNSILLRWAPVDAKTWRMAHEYGYMLKRYTILRNKKIPKVIDQVTLSDTIKPAPVAQWEAFINDKYVGIAAECIYTSVYKGVPTDGNPNMAYKKYKEEQERFSFSLYAADQSIKAAELSGLYFIDRNTADNEKYLYKLYINAPDSVVRDSASVFTGQSAYTPLPKPQDFVAHWEDKSVTLTWGIKALNQVYNSYIVEKSTDSGKSYQRLGENAIVQVSDIGVQPFVMSKKDSLPNNTDVFCYRIRGINAFGQFGPVSDSILGKGTLPLDNAPVITSDELINNQKVALTWEYPDHMNDYITGFKLYRSSSPKGKKELIMDGELPSQRTFMDTTPKMTNYYRISAYNAQSEKLSALISYVARVDSFPPLKPMSAGGIVDSTGIVSLAWKANTEEDLKGYRVYRSNHPDFEYTLCTPMVINDTLFSDSINLKTLTKNIYYKIKAEDVRQNQSPFSDVIAIRRPDVVPPSVPLLQSIENKDNQPFITWVNSGSEDVMKHHIYRLNAKDSAYIVLHSFAKDTSVFSTFLDKTVKPGNTYTYKILAEDESELLSKPSKTMRFKVASGINEQIKLKARVQTDRVKLSWNIKTEKAVLRVLIYRAINEGALKLYDRCETQLYYDTQLSPGKTYRYAIKAIFEDESSSFLSKDVTIKF